MSQMDFLEQLPYAAFEVRDGAISAINAAAQAQLPSLVRGSPVPEGLVQPLANGQSAGSFAYDQRAFLFTRVDSPSSELILFQPAQDSPLTGSQLDGFSRLMRQQMGTLFNQIGLLSGQVNDQEDAISRVTGLNHSFHQILRLVNDLEFLNIPLDQAKALFRPVSMDLAGLCQSLKRQTAPLLRKAGVELEFATSHAGLLIPGDPELLQRMLLGLISNAAKAAPGGVVVLRLQTQGDRAVLTVSDSSQTPVELSQPFQPRPADAIPTPEEGAGMGLGVIQRVVALHDGALLTLPGKGGGLTFVVSLPTGPMPLNMALNSPKPETDGGISPFLMELADLLPAELFRPDFD